MRLSVVASVRTGGLEYSGDAMSPRPIASYPLHLRAPQHVPLGRNFDFPFSARGSKRVIFSFSPILSTALSSLSRASTRRAEPDEATRGKRASCLTSISNPFSCLSHPSAERRRGGRSPTRRREYCSVISCSCLIVVSVFKAGLV